VSAGAIGTGGVGVLIIGATTIGAYFTGVLKSDKSIAGLGVGAVGAAVGLSDV
jgi:hypothetical protein